METRHDFIDIIVRLTSAVCWETWRSSSGTITRTRWSSPPPVWGLTSTTLMRSLLPVTDGIFIWNKVWFLTLSAIYHLIFSERKAGGRFPSFIHIFKFFNVGCSIPLFRLRLRISPSLNLTPWLVITLSEAGSDQRLGLGQADKRYTSWLAGTQEISLSTAAHSN